MLDYVDILNLMHEQQQRKRMARAEERKKKKAQRKRDKERKGKGKGKSSNDTNTSPIGKTDSTMMSMVDPEHCLKLSIRIVQHLSDHVGLLNSSIYLPSRDGRLVLAPSLVYDDAPWITESKTHHTTASTSSLQLKSSSPSTAEKGKDGKSLVSSSASSASSVSASLSHLTFVHPKISNDVAGKLGVRSLRRLMLSNASHALQLDVNLGTCECV